LRTVRSGLDAVCRFNDASSISATLSATAEEASSDCRELETPSHTTITYASSIRRIAKRSSLR
jgi:hypothetical protein